MLSLVYITYRPGGFDILADALRNQSYQNYELIVVDDMVSRQKLVKDYLEDQGLHVVYVGPSKKHCFPEVGYNVVNAWNTGVLRSTGDVVVFMCDYQWYHPNSLKRWLSWGDKFKEKTCVVCGGDMFDDHRSKDFNGLLSIWEPYWKPGDALVNGCTYAFTWIPEYFEMPYTAYPWELLEEINGFPECCDCFAGAGQFDLFIEKIESVGSIFVDREHKMQMINHRDWEPIEMWHQGRRRPKGSTVFVRRSNCFDLKKHVRGEL